MNRRMFVFVVLVGLLLSLQAFAGPATAQKPAQATSAGDVRGRVVSDGLRVRSQPNNTSAQLGLLKRLETVTVLGKNTNSTWLLIRSDTGITGWVGSAYVELSQGTLKDVSVADESAAVGTAAPTLTPTPAGTEAVVETPCPPTEGTPGAVTAATPVTGSQVVGRVTSDGLRIRSLPNNTSPQLGLLKRLEAVTVLGRNTSGTWLLVQTDTGITGWVGSAYVVLTAGKMADVSVKDETAAPTEATAAATEDTTLTGTPCPPAETPAATTAAASGVKGRVISSEGLRVRTQPNNTSAQIALLKAATFVTVIGKNTNSTWLLVQSDTGITGWVGSAFVALTEGSLKDVPVADESAPVGTPSAP